ncbi:MULTISPECIES: helix-turn-helix domain-containing protein [unclassified Chryseobacterium]|uniref:helix-turn-helix domain-containing protein n=1 Tax=unclassified Chryseobacterium TaxID=2593645 RepID=UPI00100A31E5|nr:MULTISPECIES: helix-turn-helix domain-containing protein [unclassified Chryseobacterium]RXM50619.1 transposase [Chryseobacterium sp. CH25]RXM63252.1 transposase [Chryseobacterium sp. CH1]
MDEQIPKNQLNKPNYIKIFSDIIEFKFPQKKNQDFPLLQKDSLSALEVIKMNKMVFDTTENNEDMNQKHRCYDEETIRNILEYQRKNKFNNIQLAKHFKLSRNTVSKWRKIFL